MTTTKLINLKFDAILFFSQATWNSIAHLYTEGYLWVARKHGLRITYYRSNELGILLKSCYKHIINVIKLALMDFYS